MSPNKPTERQPIRVILAQDEVKKNNAKSGSSEEDIAKLFAPMAGVSAGNFQLSMKLGDALGKQLKIKNSKKIDKIFHSTYAVVVRAAAAALGSLKYEITTLLDTPRGSVIEAKMPTDIFSLGGSLLFEINEESASLIHVFGSSEIKGQLYDWGKGKRALNEVFENIEKYVNLLSPET